MITDKALADIMRHQHRSLQPALESVANAPKERFNPNRPNLGGRIMDESGLQLQEWLAYLPVNADDVLLMQRFSNSIRLHDWTMQSVELVFQTLAMAYSWLGFRYDKSQTVRHGQAVFEVSVSWWLQNGIQAEFTLVYPYTEVN